MVLEFLMFQWTTLDILYMYFKFQVIIFRNKEDTALSFHKLLNCDHRFCPNSVLKPLQQRDDFGGTKITITSLLLGQFQ